jgi:hypothetical protein
MYGLVYSNMVDYAKKEGFAAGGSSTPVFLALLMIALLVVIQLFIVQWLWNTVLVRVTSVARPIPNLLYTLGLLVLVAMVHPGCAVAA